MKIFDTQHAHSEFAKLFQQNLQKIAIRENSTLENLVLEF